MTFSITTLSIMTLSIATRSIESLFALLGIKTFSINYTQHNNAVAGAVMLSVAIYLFYAECHYAECCYAECRGAIFFRFLEKMFKIIIFKNVLRMLATTFTTLHFHCNFKMDQ
jgi:hypothetical protein